MAEPVWGLLAKAQDDPETIEEAITRLIGAHLADAQAHANADESIHTHKDQAIVDHPAHSVVRDKINYDRHTIDESFTSLDRWAITNNAIVSGSGLWLETDAVLNNISRLELEIDEGATESDHLALNAFAETVVKAASNTNITAYFGILTTTVSGVGFKIVNDKLYAHYIDLATAEQNTELVGIDPTDWHKYTIDASIDTNVRLYVDEVLKATIAKALIRENEHFFEYYIKTTAETIESLFAESLHYDEDFQS